MGFLRTTGRVFSWAFKPAVNVPAWLGARHVIGLSRDLFSRLKQTFQVTKAAERPETFEQAVQRLQLSESDLAIQQRSLLRLTFFYLIVALAILGYSIFMFWGGSFAGGFLSMALSILAFANAFRHHFWYFQYKHQKLGCTVKEWWNSNIEES